MDYTSFILYSQLENIHRPLLTDADHPERYLSWQQYTSLVKRIAVSLQALGMADQDCVGLLSSNDIYYYVLGDGAIAAGAVFAPIPTFVKQQELENSISAALVKWLFVEPDFLDFVLSTAEEIGFPTTRIIVFDPPGRESYSGPRDSLRRLLSTSDESLFVNMNEGRDPKSRIAHRIFTSGTTGSVKAAELSHATQVARMTYRGPVVRGPTSRSLYMIGIYHSTGHRAITHAVTGRGPAVYVSKSLTEDQPHIIIDRISSLGITSALLSPGLLKKITHSVASGIRPRESLQSLRAITLAGSFCPTDIAQQARAVLPGHTRMIVVYATTETGAIASTEIDSSWVSGQVGRIVGQMEVKIVTLDTLEEVKGGGEGEICVRGAMVITGYCNNPAANEAALLPGEDGWFRTGDKGSFQASDTVLTLTGRVKGRFKVRELEVAPAEVEGHLKKHPGIEDAHITSTPARHAESDFECKAYIVPATDSQLTAQGVVDYVASILASHKAPTGAVVFCNEIPRGPMGKPVRTLLDKILPLPGSAEFLHQPL